MTQRQLCKKCLRDEATQHDWDTTEGGRGVDLCWGNEGCDTITDGFREESSAMVSLLIKWNELINSTKTTSLDLINFVVDNQGEVRRILARVKGDTK